MVLTVLSAACASTAMSVGGGWSPSAVGTPSSKCNTSRLAHVKNPTSGAVAVYGFSYLTGGPMPAVLGEVAAGAEEDFRLSTDMGNEIQFRWASEGEQRDSRELKKVKYKIRCEEKSWNGSVTPSAPRT